MCAGDSTTDNRDRQAQTRGTNDRWTVGACKDRMLLNKRGKKHRKKKDGLVYSRDRTLSKSLSALVQSA